MLVRTAGAESFRIPSCSAARSGGDESDGLADDVGGGVAEQRRGGFHVVTIPRGGGEDGVTGTPTRAARRRRVASARSATESQTGTCDSNASSVAGVSAVVGSAASVATVRRVPSMSVAVTIHLPL
jgi:hypothetical protein